jgi:hypothetical protein
LADLVADEPGQVLKVVRGWVELEVVRGRLIGVVK